MAVPEEDIDNLKFCYSVFDKVGDLKVEANRLIDVLRSLGLNPIQGTLDKIIDDAKLTGQRVDFETFYGIYKQYNSMKNFTASYEDMAEGWACFDREGGGMVGIGEMTQVLLIMGDKMTEAQIETILKEHDADGQIPYKEVIKKIMTVQKPDEE